MSKISEMPAPSGALTGLELFPVLQAADNAGLPLLALGSVPRGAVLLLRRGYLTDLSATADADPGAGNVRWNNADPDAATVLYVSDVDAEAANLSASWADLSVDGFLYAQGAGTTEARGNWQKWKITSVTDASGYVKVGVSLQASAGAFSDNDTLELTMQDPSPAGDGDVVGPASSVADRIALFDGTSGKLLKDGGKSIAELRAPAIQSVTSAGTVTPTFSDDMVKITAQAASLTLANPTGTSIPGLGIVIRIKDNGTARAISYGSQYRAIGVTLPTTTVISKTLYLAMVYNSDDTKWDVVAVGQEA